MRKKGFLSMRFAVFLVIAAAVAAVCLLFYRGNVAEAEISGRADPYARPVGEKPMGPEEIQNGLQEEADDAMFRFKINTSPHFTASCKDGDWCIINSPENRYSMVVVVADGSGKELYRSQKLKPGEQEMTGDLAQTLPPGEHPATATAYAIDPQSGKSVSSVETDVMITVD